MRSNSWKQLWRDHSMLIVMSIGLTVFAIFSMIAGYAVWVSDQETHGAPLQLSGFWVWWVLDFLHSNQAEFFGAALMVYFTKKLSERGSPETGDTKEETR